jgi:hypothetical protein
MNKVVNVSPLLLQHLFVEMADGQCGEFDMSPYVESDFFSRLKDDAYFKQVAVFFVELAGLMGRILGPIRLLRGW